VLEGTQAAVLADTRAAVLEGTRAAVLADTQAVVPVGTRAAVPAGTPAVVPAGTRVAVPAGTQAVVPADTRAAVHAGLQAAPSYYFLESPAPLLYLPGSLQTAEVLPGFYLRRHRIDYKIFYFLHLVFRSCYNTKTSLLKYISVLSQYINDFPRFTANLPLLSQM